MNPAAAEVYGNGIDEDCDGSTLVRRLYLSGLATGAANDFTFQSSQVWPAAPALPDGVLVQAQKPLVWKQHPTWSTGEATVNVDIKQVSQGAACKLKVRTGSTVWEQALVAGANSLAAAGLLPGSVLDEVRVYCTTGSLVVDWFTLQNGAVHAAPIQDLLLEGWESMYTAGRNQGPTFARSSPSGDYVFIGTQGGFAWTDDLLAWHMANGTRADIAYPDLLFFQDVLPVEITSAAPPRLWAIIGGAVDDFRDGLWWSDDLGEAWTRSIDGFWASQRYSDCPSDKQQFGTGALMAQLPGELDFLALENGDAAGSPDRGLYAHDGSTAATPYSCRAVDNLPAKHGAALAMRKDAAGADIVLVGFRVVPGDPASLPSGEDANTLYACTLPGDWSCASYHGPALGPGDCLPITWADGEAFTPDVRDLDVDPSAGEEGVVFVADGGYRGTGTGDCEWDLDNNDSTVWRVDLGGVDVAQLIADHDADPVNNPGYIEATIADTDGTDAEPVWIPAGQIYSEICGGTFAGEEVIPHVGDLVSIAPGNEYGSFVTLAVDPGGRYLFAAGSTGVTGYGRDYACPTLFRLDIDDPSASWLPMNEATADDVDDRANREQRRDVTYADPDDVASEPMFEVYTDRTITAMTFFGDDVDADLYLGTYTPWYIPQTDYSFIGSLTEWGWDGADYSELGGTIEWDPDETVHMIGWTDDAEGDDCYDPRDLAVCHGCATSSSEPVDLVATTGGQTANFMAYGGDSTGHREAGDFDCHWNTILSGATAQAIWEPDLDDTLLDSGRRRPQLWTAFGQSGNNDHRGIIFSEWDDEAPGRVVDYDDNTEVGWSNPGYGTPCWDAYAESLANDFRTTNAVLGPAREAWECSDGEAGTTVSDLYFDPWWACAAGDTENPLTGINAYLYGFAENGTETAGVGTIQVLDVVDQDLALAGAEDPCDSTGCDGHADWPPGGAGLWLLHRRLDGSIAYLLIPGNPDTDPDDGYEINVSDGAGGYETGATCVMGYTGVAGQYQMFESGAYEQAPSLAVDRSWWRDHLERDEAGGATASLRAFAGSKHQACGLVEIRVDLDYDASTDTWSVVGTPEWLSMDYDGDVPTPMSAYWNRNVGTACKPIPFEGELRGLELTDDGEWLMVYGGPGTVAGTTTTYRTQVDANMGVCAIRVGNERADLTSGSVYWPETPNPNPDDYCTGGGTCTPVRVPYHAEQAVDRGLMVATSALVSDPYTQGMFYGGVIALNCNPCDTTLSPQRPYILQRKSLLLTPTVDVTTAWTWKRVDITDLQQPWTGSMAWGSAVPGEPVDRLYLGAWYGGMWEGRLGW